MVTSYQFSERFDALSVLQNTVVALWSLLRTLLFVLGLAVCLAGVFALGGAVVALLALCWLTIVQVVAGLAIIAAYGWATYPRPKAVAK